MRRLPYKIICVSCRTHLYFYHGEFEGPFDYTKFKPVTSGIPVPKPKREMSCKECGKAWYMVTHRGYLVVMTDKGWKPRDPEGPPKIVKPEERGLVIGHRESSTEFKEE